MNDDVRVFAPATVANVACGFDIFGFALEVPGDEVYVKKNDSSFVKIVEVTGDGGCLPREPHLNTAGVGVLKLLEHLKNSQGFDIHLHKQMPLGSGLGSSAASSAASLFAVNHLLGYPLTIYELLPFAMESERVACGAGHADNVAPSLLGGFVLIRSYEPLDVIRIPCILDLYCTILYPHIEVRTEESRKILKRGITLQQHIEQSGNAAGLIAGIMLGDGQLVGRCLHDSIAEPIRSMLIPDFKKIKMAAMDSGALGASISGSGPSLFALSLSEKNAISIGEAMLKAAHGQGSLYISKVSTRGAVIRS